MPDLAEILQRGDLGFEWNAILPKFWYNELVAYQIQMRLPNFDTLLHTSRDKSWNSRRRAPPVWPVRPPPAAQELRGKRVSLGLPC